MLYLKTTKQAQFQSVCVCVPVCGVYRESNWTVHIILVKVRSNSSDNENAYLTPPKDSEDEDSKLNTSTWRSGKFVYFKLHAPLSLPMHLTRRYITLHKTCPLTCVTVWCHPPSEVHPLDLHITYLYWSTLILNVCAVHVDLGQVEDPHGRKWGALVDEQLVRLAERQLCCWFCWFTHGERMSVCFVITTYNILTCTLKFDIKMTLAYIYGIHVHTYLRIGLTLSVFYSSGLSFSTFMRPELLNIELCQYWQHSHTSDKIGTLYAKLVLSVHCLLWEWTTGRHCYCSYLCRKFKRTMQIVHTTVNGRGSIVPHTITSE